MDGTEILHAKVQMKSYTITAVYMTAAPVDQSSMNCLDATNRFWQRVPVRQ